MRTITLELLRHGPPNNQLLSPLTPYLALCENHAAVTINVPFEHNQFLHRLSALSYKHGMEPRNFYINDTAKALGDILSSVPGLTAELSRNDNDGGQMTHLRLVVSSSELALLPFELALSPNGFPGTGQHLLLQSQAPLCITREVRRVPDKFAIEARIPKILLVAASPPGFEPVPLQSHLLALRAAVDPWVSQHGAGCKLTDHIVVLPQASDLEIEAACAQHDFTHIHILAHGVEYEDGYDVRFGLALHDSRNPDADAAIISGARLATALRPTQEANIDDLARPAVVTIASCNSGSQGSVAGAGASVAHALHDSGIPIVVASQFPLTFEGSVRMVEVLYEGLLWGEDPRSLLCDLRRKLHSQFPNNHDWASLTAYAALPPTLVTDLNVLKYNQAKRSVEVAMSFADQYINYLYDRADGQPEVPDALPDRPDIEEAQRRIEFAKTKMGSLLNESGKFVAEIYGFLASTEKRQAEIIQENSYESVESLKRSRDYYWKAYVADRSNGWGIVQYLSLVTILSCQTANGDAVVERDDDMVNKFVGVGILDFAARCSFI